MVYVRLRFIRPVGDPFSILARLKLQKCVLCFKQKIYTFCPKHPACSSAVLTNEMVEFGSEILGEHSPVS